MSQIYLVRHGATAWNKAKIFRGRRDVPLDEQGRLEAASAAEALRAVALGRIFSSPLSRACDTAQAIAVGRGIEVIVEPAFIDIDYGEWTEYWDSEARVKFGGQYRQWKEAPHLVQFPGGESLDDVRRRAVPRLKDLAREAGDGAIAIVSHRVVVKLMLLEAKGLDNSHFWEVRPDTGAISALEYRDGMLRVIFENDTRHLRAHEGRGVADF